jgi:hypothetical protein
MGIPNAVEAQPPICKTKKPPFFGGFLSSTVAIA